MKIEISRQNFAFFCKNWNLNFRDENWKLNFDFEIWIKNQSFDPEFQFFIKILNPNFNYKVFIFIIPGLLPSSIYEKLWEFQILCRFHNFHNPQMKPLCHKVKNLKIWHIRYHVVVFVPQWSVWLKK